MSAPWSVQITQRDWRQLESHLFPGDRDEHAAVLRCGIVRTARGSRLLVRDIRYARDGVDYIPGDRGYRKLTPEFVLAVAESCADEQLVYLSVHCHGGTDRVAFSDVDIASHERGYPALLDITQSPAVGGLVFARNAVAGELWLHDGARVEIAELRVVGRPQRTLYPSPQRARSASETYDRQSRIFGDRGQDILSRQRVAIIGLGGAGSIVNEYLARLGVGELLLIDPDRIEATNLPRVVGARRADAWTFFTNESRPKWIRRLGLRLSTPKVKIAERVAKQASRAVRVETIFDDVMVPWVAAMLRDVDQIFLAADSHSARRLVDALTHQYFVPATQIGAKVSLAAHSGDITDAFSVIRMSLPGAGCLRCNQLISPSLLQEEAKSATERHRQRYLDDDAVPAPSVIALNAVSAAHAVNDWMMSVTGVVDQAVDTHRWVAIHPLTDEIDVYALRQDVDCPNCGPIRFALGDAKRLPVKLR